MPRTACQDYSLFSNHNLIIMTTKTTRSQDEPQAPAEATPPIIPVTTTAPKDEPQVMILLLHNVRIRSHWHPKGLTLPVALAQAKSLETLGMARIIGI